MYNYNKLCSDCKRREDCTMTNTGNCTMWIKNISDVTDDISNIVDEDGCGYKDYTTYTTSDFYPIPKSRRQRRLEERLKKKKYANHK